MPLFNNISRKNSRLVFFISIVVLLAAFFMGFYYYYVPSNKQNVNKYAFLILENIKTSVNRNTDNIKSLYGSFLKQNSNCRCSVDSLTAKAQSQGLDGKPSHLVPGINCNRKGIEDFRNNSDSNYSVLADISTNQLVFLFHNLQKDINHKDTGQEDIYISVPLNNKSVPPENKFEPFFKMHQHELFNSFLLLKACGDTGHILYKDATLNIGDNITIDSLLPKNRGLTLPGTRDIQIEGLNHKMFYIPFTYDSQQLLLCGFVPENEYESKLHVIPVSFIYPFVILFLLLIIALPTIKFYIMGPEEEIKFRDLILFVLSLFIGGALITLVIIQVILLKDGNIRAEGNLDSISAQIDNNFTQEVNKAYRQLAIFDSIVARDWDSITKNKKNRYDISDTVKNYIIAHKEDSSLYQDLYRLYWINSDGRQFVKATLGQGTFNDVKERNYFKAFANDMPYRLPNDHDSTFGIEPLYNWVNGEFSTVISKKSRVRDAFIASLTTPMLSLTKTIQPEGYGFCIIDQEGNVQYHSDSSRNLLENFISQLESPTMVKEAIAARQKMISDNTGFYGKEYCLNIRPLTNLPFFLITFYDKGYIVPVNMRILIFSLLFCLISFVIYASIWFFIFRKSYYSYALLYSPMNYMHYIIPKRVHLSMYIKINLFLLLYIIMLLSLTFLSKFSNIDGNHQVLMMTILTPFNIGTGLMVLIYKLNVKKYKQAKWLSGLLLVISALIALCICLLSKHSYIYFIIVETIFIACLGIYYFTNPRIASSILNWWKEKYLFLHAMLGLLLIICISVLPASLFTWYPHNQEIIQSVKKQQLFLAKELDKRRNIVQKYLTNKDTIHSRNYYEKLFYKYGIYTIHDDTISLTHTKPDSITSKGFDDFYFDISNGISNQYYDPQKFPALKDSSSDSTWSWYYPNLGSLTFLFKTSPHTFNPGPANQGDILQIRSKIPQRYLFLTGDIKGLIMILLILTLLYGLYRLLRDITYKLSLKKFISSYKEPESPAIDQLIDKYKLNSFLAKSIEEKLRKLPHEYETSSIPNETSEIIRKEEEIIFLIEPYKDFYNFIWQKCSDEEKYLLYGFANEGLMNFKNTIEIYKLLKEGILIIMPEQEKIELFSKSFRAYIIGFLPANEINSLHKKFKENSAWQSFRIPFLVILLVLASFIFFTQQDTWQRIMALIAGFSSTLPLLMNLFSRKTGSTSASN